MTDDRRTLYGIFGTLVVLAILALCVCAKYALADEKPDRASTAFTEDCKPAIEIIGRLVIEKHEKPWKVASVGGVAVILTYNPETKTVSFVADCGNMEWGKEDHGQAKPVVMARILFTMEGVDDADMSRLPGFRPS